MPAAATHDSTAATLPLRLLTPPAWAASALRDPLALLNDHAHLEKKAASNALELLHRWPEPSPPENWVRVMTAVARDEVDHLAIVCKLISRRGGTLTKNHRNPYATALRELVRLGKGTTELMDRLMVSALIELRSCERFKLLSDACATKDNEDKVLAKLYRELWASEHGHYLVFLDLAREVEPSNAVEKRWHEMLEAESRIMREQTPGPRMHSWID